MLHLLLDPAGSSFPGDGAAVSTSTVLWEVEPSVVERAEIEPSVIEPVEVYIHTFIHKLYLSLDFSVAYIASISDPN